MNWVTCLKIAFIVMSVGLIVGLILCPEQFYRWDKREEDG